MKLNFIVTTLNGYVIERVEIGDYVKESSGELLDKLYSEGFTSKHIGEFVYIDDVTGNADDVDLFVENQSSKECECRKMVVYHLILATITCLKLFIIKLVITLTFM